MNASAVYTPAPLRRVTQSKIAKGLAQPRPELAQFARTLLEAMLRKKMNASSVARAVWGTTTNKEGFTVAKNRDRIGQYLAGASYPKPETLVLLAKALDLDPASLRVDNLPGAGPTARAQAMAPTEVNMVVMAGYAGFALLQINKLLPVELCLSFLKQIHEHDMANPSPGDEGGAAATADVVQTLIEEPDPAELADLRDDLAVRRTETRKTPKRASPAA
jgi:hypothetical protein